MMDVVLNMLTPVSTHRASCAGPDPGRSCPDRGRWTGKNCWRGRSCAIARRSADRSVRRVGTTVLARVRGRRLANPGMELVCEHRRHTRKDRDRVGPGLAAVARPADHLVAARRDPGERERAVFHACDPGTVHDLHRGPHVLVDIAVDVDVAGIVEPVASPRAVVVATQIELIGRGRREHVVFLEVVIGQYHRRPDGHDLDLRIELLAALDDAHGRAVTGVRLSTLRWKLDEVDVRGLIRRRGDPLSLLDDGEAPGDGASHRCLLYTSDAADERS